MSVFAVQDNVERIAVYEAIFLVNSLWNWTSAKATIYEDFEKEYMVRLPWFEQGTSTMSR